MSGLRENVRKFNELIATRNHRCLNRVVRVSALVLEAIDSDKELVRNKRNVKYHLRRKKRTREINIEKINKIMQNSGNCMESILQATNYLLSAVGSVERLMQAENQYILHEDVSDGVNEGESGGGDDGGIDVLGQNVEATIPVEGLDGVNEGERGGGGEGETNVLGPNVQLETQPNIVEGIVPAENQNIISEDVADGGREGEINVTEPSAREESQANIIVEGLVPSEYQNILREEESGGGGGEGETNVLQPVVPGEESQANIVEGLGGGGNNRDRERVVPQSGGEMENVVPRGNGNGESAAILSLRVGNLKRHLKERISVGLDQFRHVAEWLVDEEAVGCGRQEPARFLFERDMGEMIDVFNQNLKFPMKLVKSAEYGCYLAFKRGGPLEGDFWDVHTAIEMRDLSEDPGPGRA